MSKLYKNPILFFGIAALIIGLILLFSTFFISPDFYVNKELANEIAQTALPSETEEAVKHLLNPWYWYFNSIEQVWGILIAFFCFAYICKITYFKKFTELTFLNSKLFIYLWINLIYPIFGFCFIGTSMVELDKYVYHSSRDSMGIPLFGFFSTVISFGIIYYLVMNTLALIIYNTKKNIFFKLIWALLVFSWLALLILYSFSCKFSLLSPMLDFIYLVWIIFTIYMLGYKKQNTQLSFLPHFQFLSKCKNYDKILVIKKDIIALLNYLISVIFGPLILFALTRPLFLSTSLVYVDKDLFHFIFFLCIILPAILTLVALKFKWSKYVNWFYDNLLHPTTLLIILIDLTYLYDNLILFYLWAYIVIYITICFRFIIKKIKCRKTKTNKLP